MVEIPPDHSGCSVQVGIFISRLFCKGQLLISHSVRLDVRFIYNIKSITVAERIPTRIIRIVTCTYRIDVELLHYKDITDHILFRNNISLVRIDLMSVCTFDKYWLSVDQKLIADDSDISETDFN